MRTKIFAILAVLLMTVGFLAIVPEESEAVGVDPYAIYGTVTYLSTAQAGKTVTILDVNSGESATTTTDSSGQYVYD